MRRQRRERRLLAPCQSVIGCCGTHGTPRATSPRRTDASRIPDTREWRYTGNWSIGQADRSGPRLRCRAVKSRSAMPKSPDVSVVVEQVKARLKQIEDLFSQHQRLVAELERLRDAILDLERMLVSQLSGGPRPWPSRPGAPASSPGAKQATAPARTPRGQNKAKILDALQGHEPMTASEIAKVTDIARRHRQHDPHQDGQDRRTGQGQARLHPPAITSAPDRGEERRAPRRLRRRPGCRSRRGRQPLRGLTAQARAQRRRYHEGARTARTRCRGVQLARPLAWGCRNEATWRAVPQLGGVRSAGS